MARRGVTFIEAEKRIVNDLPPMPKGFSAEEWAHALESGQITVVATKPQRPLLIRAGMAPVQFIRWTLAVRSGHQTAPSKKLGRVQSVVH